MGITYLVSLAVSTRTISRLAGIVLIVGVVTTCSAESVRGVVLSNQRGPAGDFSGTLQVDTGGQVSTLYYDQSLRKNFASKSCSDIGAIWVVKVRLLPNGSRYADSALCEGKFDTTAHEAWLVVRKYLATGDPHPSASPALFSALWLSSANGREYERKSDHLDLSGFRIFGAGGLCLDEEKNEKPNYTRVLAGGDCHLEVPGGPVDLVFTVHRNDNDKRSVIDGIEIR